MSRRTRSNGQLVLIAGAIVALLAILVYVNRRPAASPVDDPVIAGPTTAPTVADAAAPTTPPLLITQTPTATTPPPTTPPPAAPQADASRDPARLANSVVSNPPATETAPAVAAAPSTRPSWDLLLASTPHDAAPAREPAPHDLPSTLTEAQRRLDAGDVVTAQALFSRALTSGQLSPDQAQRVKRALDPVGREMVFSTRRFPDWHFGGTYQVQSGDSLEKIAKLHGITWELLARMNDISDPRKLRAGRAIKVISGPFGAVIHKSRFEMEIWLCGTSLPEPGAPGSVYIASFPVGLGKAGSTPTGIWLATPGGKQKNPKFWGAGDLPPMEADDPQNPLGEFWIALTGVSGQAEGRESYGIHGTIDPSSIGKEASLGCIRLADPDIEMVYQLLVDGKSRVIVRD